MEHTPEKPARPIVVHYPDPVLMAVLDRCSVAEKVEMVSDMNALARRIVAAELRRQHPDWVDYRVQAGVLLVFLSRTPELEALGDAVTVWYHRRFVESRVRFSLDELPVADLDVLKRAILAGLPPETP